MAAPELIAPGVYRVDAVRFRNFVNVLLLENDDGWTLVDTGVAGSVGRIQEAITALGSGPGELKRIFVTHQHDDHTGGLSGLLEWAPGAEVGASAHEAEVVSGGRGMDPPSSPVFRYLARNTEPPEVPVGKVLKEGDLVSGFRIVSTPGHTRGHVSLLRDADGLMFTADAFGCLPRRIRVGVRRFLCNDPPLAKRSAEKLLAEGFATVVMSHGPILRSGARTKLREAVERCGY
ncbi:MAG: MBL fold metallo-hydrolase [Actinomycetota bacterium]|nr:MBL fold metallo-hydrolase [Actinomycetota bacterium]MDP9488343.1 MBL fold metallo-hydrolase [Actinomycetota bacterium]